jgi:ribose-phosphate pyrophosphokinase
MPYFGYARQERKSEPGTPISTRIFTTFLETLGVDRIVTFDLHAKAIEGFFLKTNVDQLYARDIFIAELKKDFKDDIQNNNIVVVAPDTGAANNARNFASALLANPDLAIISKSRLAAGKIASMELIGSVAGKTAIIVDDMADTCGTIVKAAEVVKNAGAEKVIAVLTHAIFSKDAVQKLENSVLESVYITDTIYHKKEGLFKNGSENSKIKVITVAEFLAKVIDKMEHDTHNVDNLFVN